MERGSYVFRAVESDFTHMLFDQLVSEQHTYSRTDNQLVRGAFAPEQELEQLLLVFLGDADTRIRNDNVPACLGMAGLYFHASSLRRIFQCIAQQVTQDGIDLVAVNPYLQLVKITLVFHLNAFLNGIVLELCSRYFSR